MVVERTTHGTSDLKRALETLLAEARYVSTEAEDEVAEILRIGNASPLAEHQAVALIERAIVVIREHASKRGDEATVARLIGDARSIARRILADADNARITHNGASARVELGGRDGVDPRPVHPSPYFYGHEVPMLSGFVDTRRIRLWSGNERLDVHVEQFKRVHGRSPDSGELLDIMWSKMSLPGLTGKDQFDIVKLARSIAANGVQRAPIIDLDGTPLDGNRRIAACYYILSNDEFSADEKKRAQTIFVWQLTEHATDEDRHSVVVASNFEDDFKVPWPEYVKARKVHDEWQSMLSLEGRLPNTKRQAELKRDLAKRFALGPDTGTVNRYLKMVDWANEFEHYHIVDQERDEFTVRHVASDKFQYFDELSRGTTTGGVAPTLNQDPKFRDTVFDLLLEGKFRNWAQIRELPKIYANDEARRKMEDAVSADADEGVDLIDDAISIVRMQSPGKRQLGANQRIEAFARWLEELPVKAFRDTIAPANLEALLKALRLVEVQAAAILGPDHPPLEPDQDPESAG